MDGAITLWRRGVCSALAALIVGRLHTVCANISDDTALCTIASSVIRFFLYTIATPGPMILPFDNTRHTRTHTHHVAVTSYLAHFAVVWHSLIGVDLHIRVTTFQHSTWDEQSRACGGCAPSYLTYGVNCHAASRWDAAPPCLRIALAYSIMGVRIAHVASYISGYCIPPFTTRTIRTNVVR